MRKLLTTLMLIFAVPLVAGCATVKGAGKDVQSASDSVNDALHDR